MKTYFIFIYFLLIFVNSRAQSLSDLGIKIDTIKFKGESIEYLIQSKVGEENMKKPILFLAQGSLPQPLIIKEDDYLYPIFLPFDYSKYLERYHLVVISKPHIPILLNIKDVNNNFYYTNNDSLVKYSQKNFLEYYTDRNAFLLKKIMKKKWVNKKELYLISHSEGSYIVINMAHTFNNTKKIIYSGGNPMGRVMSLISQNKFYDSKESTFDTIISNWKYNLPNDNIKSFSEKNFFKKILNIKIPIYITYGSKDWNAIFNDYLYTEVIRQKKENFKFNIYYGYDHNFFLLDKNNNKVSNIPEWQKVGDDWLNWLNK